MKQKPTYFLLIEPKHMKHGLELEPVFAVCPLGGG